MPESSPGLLCSPRQMAGEALGSNLKGERAIAPDGPRFPTNQAVKTACLWDNDVSVTGSDVH